MEFKKTITTIFMVPTLGISREALKENSFINGYVSDDSRDIHYIDSIFLLFRPSNIYKFRKFLDSEYERTKNIIEDYDHEDGFVVVVYKLNPEFKADFDLIRKSKYSQTSPAFQNLFPKVIKIMTNGKHMDEISLQYRIFNKTRDLVEFWEEQFGVTFSPDQEVWRWFNEEDEILNVKKIVT